MCFRRFVCLGHSGVLGQSTTVAEIQCPKFLCECIIGIFISIIASATLHIIKEDCDCSVVAY